MDKPPDEGEQNKTVTSRQFADIRIVGDPTPILVAKEILASIPTKVTIKPIQDMVAIRVTLIWIIGIGAIIELVEHPVLI